MRAGRNSDMSAGNIQPNTDHRSTLSLDAFVRSFGISASPLSILIGAGASISSGVPSATRCIWEWKRNIFLTNNPGLENQFKELSLPNVREKIQQWLDNRGHFPPDGAPNEYGFYIQHCFPIKADRRRYFQKTIRGSRPHIGYILLCHLAEAGLVHSVWSTNFDGLVARAAANFDLTPVEIGIDSQHRLTSLPAQGELMCVSLHGDYRYDALKNTTEELQTQETCLCDALIRETQKASLVVVGYSGRDQSIMRTLNSAYSGHGDGSLFWCGHRDADPPHHVAALIDHARNNQREAYYVPTLGFDDLMTRLARHCLHGQQLEDALHCIAAFSENDVYRRDRFQVQKFPTSTLIKSNAFRIRCPKQVLEFGLQTWPDEQPWASLRETAGDLPLVVAPLNKRVLALGSTKDICGAFGPKIEDSVNYRAVGPSDLSLETGAIISLMRQALVRSLAESAKIETDKIKKLWRSNVLRTERLSGITYSVHEAAHISFRWIDNVEYLVIMPSLTVLDTGGNEASPEVSRFIKHKILGYQHNKQFNKALNDWRETLFDNGNQVVFTFPPNSESGFSFRVDHLPIFARIGSDSVQRPLVGLEKIQHLIKHQGFQLPEPRLIFSNKEASGPVWDTHPIRGILTNQPYDYPLTVRGLSSSVRIGVVCPATGAETLRRYLESIRSKHISSSSDRDYVLDYPGFQTAYGLPIELPQPGSTGWITCPDPSTDDPIRGALDAARFINQSIEQLLASYAPSVVLIYIPHYWEPFRSFGNESGRFDLHDFVKASCVQRGIATQFLNEDTLSDDNQCRIWWWLSLALYTKSMRTPWLLESLSRDTAFVGLGFSIDSNAPKGGHVVLGCSHIYSAHGEGLQYRLSKIEDPLIRRGNPFMSGDDARQVGDSIRQMFFDANMGLPKRVVIHKRTPFLKAEREGLFEGLGGVESIDMLEIRFDHALRYVASIQRGDGRSSEDNFPVRRGTVMKLDDYRALLWIHGATKALCRNRHYYQGKRRIPAPLIIKRHAGETALQDVAKEILGLSKMNWNTFDLYTKLPASLQSSSDIARIGSLLRRFSAVSYDYRLFI